MEQKPFAIGVRMEHRQESISRTQFGDAWEKLPPADYKLVCHLPTGRSAYSYCVCPGGEIVATASQPERLVTNGMSNRARDGGNQDEALGFYQKSLNVKGDNPQVIYDMAGIYAARDERDQANELFGQVIMNYPGTELAELAREARGY